jgi:hypothetical protein
VLRRVAGLSGLQRLTFDGRTDFDDRYLLFARDTSAMRRVLTPPVIDAWVADPGWFLEGRGDQWLVYRLNERVPAGAIPDLLDRSIGLVQRLASP